MWWQKLCFTQTCSNVAVLHIRKISSAFYFFLMHLNASQLPLLQAAPDFLSVRRRADRRTDDSPPAEKKHHVKTKYIKRDTQNAFVTVRTYSLVSSLPGQRVYRLCREWMDRAGEEQDSLLSGTSSLSLRLTLCLPVNRWTESRFTGGNYDWRLLFCLVMRLSLFGLLTSY